MYYIKIKAEIHDRKIIQKYPREESLARSKLSFFKLGLFKILFNSLSSFGLLFSVASLTTVVLTETLFSLSLTIAAF